MSQVLLTLGGLTLGGSAAVGLLALAGRPARGRYGTRWRCWGWLLLCLRLALPLPLAFHGEARAPIRMDVPNPAVTQTPPATAPPPGGGQMDPVPPAAPEVSAPAAPQNRDPVVGPEAASPIPVSHILMAVWLTGAAALLAWNGWSHLRFLSYLRRWSSPVTDGEAVRAFNQLGDRLGLRKRPRLLVCRGLTVPMLAGVIHPVILLPGEELSGRELGFSLLHELTHYRRRDIWLKTLAMWVNALHWFNPFMWYMARLVERDTELACDEDALRALPPEDCAAYGQTILAAVARLQERRPL